MRSKGFKGGIHLSYQKDPTQDKPIKRTKIPSIVTIPFSQHTGSICEPIVKVGDKVKVGTKLGEGKGFISSPVHSSISGTVSRIENFPHPVIGSCLSVVIEGDGNDELESSVQVRSDIYRLTQDEIRFIIRDYGVVGLGGAAFPTHVKLNPPKSKSIDSFILNGAECEPYITCDHRLMLEKSAEILKGIEVIVKLLSPTKVFIAIEDNKPDAIKAMEDAVERTYSPNVEVITLKTKYPQGAEKQLIKTILNREVPSGGLPMDVGVVVHNVGTAVAIYEAVYENKPLYERVVTVAGSCVEEPQNLLVRIGTRANDLIDDCGGLVKEPVKLIFGGPMTGLAQSCMEVPVIKGTSAILFISEKEAEDVEERTCIRCGRCVEACPIGLLPVQLGRLIKAEKWEELTEYNLTDCIECGVCGYLCPSKIPLVQLIKIGKVKLQKHVASSPPSFLPEADPPWAEKLRRTDK